MSSLTIIHCSCYGGATYVGQLLLEIQLELLDRLVLLDVDNIGHYSQLICARS